MGIENHVTAKIKWIAVKTAQAQLDHLRAMAIKPMTEVPPAELVLSSALHHCGAHYVGVQHQSRGIICCVRCQGIWKMSLSRPSVLQHCYLHFSDSYTQCGLDSLHTHFFAIVYEYCL